MSGTSRIAQRQLGYPSGYQGHQKEWVSGFSFHLPHSQKLMWNMLGNYRWLKKSGQREMMTGKRGELSFRLYSIYAMIHAICGHLRETYICIKKVLARLMKKPFKMNY